MMQKVLTAAVLLLPLTAKAQLSPAAKFSQVAANQLGILEYCHDKGNASADAVAAEREAFLSAPSTHLSTVPAERLGRAGVTVTPDGQQLSIGELAVQQGTSLKALCHDLADSSMQFQIAMHKAAHSGKPIGTAQ